MGRSHALATLDAHLDAAQTGRGSTVFLAGEAGIGKSRLVAEVRARAVARGMSILGGHCFEPDRILPYAPLLDLLRTQLAGQPGDAVARDIAAIAPELVWLLPDLARFMPDGAPTPSIDLAHDQRRLAHVLIHLIARLASSNPVLVVVEDLHWSDGASIDVLLHLARRLDAQPIVLLLTYRSDEVNPDLRHMLAQVDRERLGSEVVLLRLALAEVDGMLRAIFGQPQPIRADFLRAIHDLTDGNPFFVEEVVRSLVASGDIFPAGGRWERRALANLQIPRSVHDAVLRSTRNLRPEAGRVLRLAAVAGRFFDFAVLQALTADTEEQLLELVRELAGAQLVVEESADRFAFRHALTREAIYSEMLTRERRALHLTIAETLEQLHTDLPAAYLYDLSSHFTAAEAWDKAMSYGERAGTHALTLFAPGAAVEHFTRAVNAAARQSIAPSSRLYRERGRALALLGDFDGALRDYQAVLESARTEGDGHAEWQALMDLGDLWSGYDYDRAGDNFDQALQLARSLDSPAAQAESLAQLGNWHLNSERTDEAEQYLQSALVYFEQAGDRSAIARTVDLLGTVSDIGGDVSRMRRRYERAAALFHELGDRQGLSSTLATMCLHGGVEVFATVVTPAHISLEQTVDEAQESVSLARDIDWRAGEAYAVLCWATSLVWCGHYGPALTLARDGLAVAREIDHREWTAFGHLSQGIIYRDLLQRPRAQEHYIHAFAVAHESGSRHWQHVTTGSLAGAHVALGNLDEAAELLSSVAHDLPMKTLGQRSVWAARAKLASARADPALALDVVDRLFTSAINLDGECDIPRLALLRGQALAALGRYDEAEETLHAALRGARDRGMRPVAWRVHRTLGRLCTLLGRRDDAGQEFQRAQVIVEELAATLPDDLRVGFLSQVAASMPAHRAQRTQTSKAGTFLTARERDVAVLVARGLSNRDVARALFIGERTVETHVGNILGKLGFGSRAQIAVWAVEAGLGRSTP